MERDLDRILEKRDEFRTEVRNFIEDFNDTLDWTVLLRVPGETVSKL